jgi:hypothetical protein
LRRRPARLPARALEGVIIAEVITNPGDQCPELGAKYGRAILLQDMERLLHGLQRFAE